MSVNSAPAGNHSRTPPRRRRPSLSPPPRRGRQHGEIIVQRVVRETSSGVQYPILTRTNYQEWSLLMRVNLQAQGLWQAVEPEDDEVVDYREDRLALAAILRAVPPEMLGSLAVKRTAQSAWEAVKTVRVGVQRVREANVQQLRKEFGEIAFKNGESVDDFSLRIAGLEKLLQVVPENLEQVAISIETLLDVDTLSIEEVTGRLRAVEQRRKPPPVVDNRSQLLLTEEWLARLKIREKNGEQGGSSSGNGGKKRGGKGRGRGRNGGARDGKSGPANGSGQERSADKCRNCGKIGHWARDCRSKPKNHEQVHVAQAEDDEPTLLMARVEHVSESTPPPPPPRASVEVHEAKVFVQLGQREERDHLSWVLDTRATNHMTGSRAAFSDSTPVSVARCASATDLS